MNDAPRKKPVTLEDLLRFKRAEQPSPEFWADFERGLRTKQLAAIVEPRPWWAPLIRIGARVSRYQLPVGVTAILAITLLTVREYGPVAATPAFEPTSSETATVAVAMPAADRASVTAEAPSAPAASVASNVAAQPIPVPAAAPARVEPAASHVAASHTTTGVGASSHLAMVNAELSSARYMAENLAAVQPTNPELEQMLGHLPAVDATNPLQGEPLAQISLAGESRSQRLLAGMAWTASANNVDSALRANEHTARRLTERRLSESDVISRLDVGGNRVTVKF